MPRDKRRPSADPLKWGRDEKLRLLAHIEAEEAAEKSRELESKGWRAWYSAIFGDEFVSNLAPHHEEAIAWHWQTVLIKRAGLNPSPNAYFAVWPRGHRKSDLIRHIAIADACLLGSGYCLYVSSSRGKVHEHALSVERLIQGDGVKEYYPKLAEVDKTLAGTQRSWTSDRMISASGYTYHFVGLKEGVAGANVDGVRPSLVVIDDADEREDSALISEQRLKVLTRAILATRQRNTVYFSAQNYISRYGVIYRIHTGKVAALSNRVHTQPIPAFYDLVTEFKTINGQPRDIIVSGTPSWPWYDLEAGQAEIDDIGLSAFLIECQHDVDVDKAGQILPEWNEDVHVITWSEFESLFGVRDIPQHWRKYCGWDWGSTTGHDCAVSWLAVAAQNSPMPGAVFFYQLMSFPPSILTGQVCRRILTYLLEDLQKDPRNYIELDFLERATGNPADPLAMSARTKIIDYLASREDFCMYHASHEAKAVRDVARIIYGLPFSACNPRKSGGVEQWRQHLRVDYNEPHPFRADAKGRSRFYMIVADDELTVPRTDEGMKLARIEFPEWRWRPSQLTAKGYVDEAPLKQYDNVPNCLTQDTLVHTAVGCKQISEIKAGEFVWTRAGLKQVLVSGMTGVAPVWTVNLSSGAVVRGTAEHPFWTTGGWKLLRELAVGDTLYTWQEKLNRNRSVLSLGECVSTATQMLNSGATATTINPISGIVRRAMERYTKKFGRLLMGQFLRDTASTIRMRIHRITNSPIWSALRDQRIPVCIVEAALLLNGWPRLGRPVSPTGNLSRFQETVTTVESCTIPSRDIADFVPCCAHLALSEEFHWTEKLFTPVCSVAKKLRGLVSTELNTVVIPVGTVGRKAIVRLRKYARFAAQNLLHFAHSRNAAAPVVVRSVVEPTTCEPVYNLEVEDQPEFFANGVLVHNSIMMLMVHFRMAAAPLTAAEQFEASIPVESRYSSLLANSPFEAGLLPEQELQLIMARAHARKTSSSQIAHFDEYGDPVR